MIDPMAEVVSLLAPSAPLFKIVTGAGRWRIRRRVDGHPFYCAVVEGTHRLSVQGGPGLLMRAGDFVLIPAARDFTVSSLDAPPPGTPPFPPHRLPNGEFRLGSMDGPADVRYLVGHCLFESPDAALLVSLLPDVVLVRSEPRLAALMQLLGDECRAHRAGREVILTRLLEVLMIEALRAGESVAGSDDPARGPAPGLARGLADERLASALRRMHEHPDRHWTVAQLAAEAALSRSTFFERFSRAVGLAPMEYLLGWRMALAKNLLRRRDRSLPGGIGAIAERVGYRSASTFGIAFARHVGMPPARYARLDADETAAGDEALI